MRQDMQTVLHLVPDRYNYNNTSSFSCYRLDAFSNTPPTVSKHWRQYDTYNNTHTHTCLMALCLGLPGWVSTRKVEPICLFPEARDSEWQWAICKSAPRSRQITMPAPQHSVFYRLYALPATQPTASRHWRQIICTDTYNKWDIFTCAQKPND